MISSKQGSEVAILYDKTGNVCIMISFSIQLNVFYPMLSKKNLKYFPLIFQLLNYLYYDFFRWRTNSRPLQILYG